MRQTNLLERMNGRSDIVPPASLPGDTTTIVLTGVARALREATEPGPATKPRTEVLLRNTRASEAGRIDAAQAVEAARTSAAAADPPPEQPSEREAETMPLLLTTRNTSPATDRDNRTVRDSAARYTVQYTAQYSAHILLGFSLLAIALLMTAPLPDIARTIGFDWPSEERRPRLARLAEPVTLDLAQNLLPDTGDTNPPVVSMEDQVLLERCEAMIARGEIKAARDELTTAAASGRALARFALAETFDPNVLAAWGLRENVADASAALIMYRQALETGDRRAAARIEALESEAAAAVKVR